MAADHRISGHKQTDGSPCGAWGSPLAGRCPKGVAPPGPNGGYPARGTAGVEGRDEKVQRVCCGVATWLDERFSAPRHQTGRVLFPASQRNDRSASWCRFPRGGARSARSILPGEALPGRRVPERPARLCGLRPADAGGPGTWDRRPMTAACGRCVADGVLPGSLSSRDRNATAPLLPRSCS